MLIQMNSKLPHSSQDGQGLPKLPTSEQLKQLSSAPHTKWQIPNKQNNNILSSMFSWSRRAAKLIYKI